MTFRPGDLVALSTKHLKLKTTSKKLSPRFIGPFRVLDSVGKQAYRLLLPNNYALIHNVFPVLLLQPWHKRDEDDSDPLPMPELEDKDEWEIEEIKDNTEFDREQYYLVK